jgi:hypothetical protein
VGGVLTAGAGADFASGALANRDIHGPAATARTPDIPLIINSLVLCSEKPFSNLGFISGLHDLTTATPDSRRTTPGGSLGT